MKVRFFAVLLVLSVVTSTNSFPQIIKDSWQFGVSGAPLFELSSSGLNGVMINLHAERIFSDRFVAGIQPYYAYTDENKSYAYDLTLQQPRSIRKDVFHSFGLNVELKFIISNGPKLMPYTSVMAGGGYTSYHLYQSNAYAELVPEDLGQFVNYNLGIGVGTYIKVSGSSYIDIRIMYTEVGASKNIKPSSYLYPTIGLMKVF